MNCFTQATLRSLRHGLNCFSNEAEVNRSYRDFNVFKLNYKGWNINLVALV